MAEEAHRRGVAKIGDDNGASQVGWYPAAAFVLTGHREGRGVPAYM